MADEKKRREAMDETVVSKHDMCSFSGKLKIDGHDYSAAFTLTREVKEFAWPGRWDLLRFDNDTSPLPEISNIGLRPWRPKDAREPLHITPEIEKSLAYHFLSKRAFTVAYNELRAILLTPNWQLWLEMDEQLDARIDEYKGFREQRNRELG